MANAHPRNVLVPWFIGIAIIAVVDAYVAWLLFATECGAPTVPRLLVVVVVPAVYLVLMYLTLKSQNGRAARP